MKQKGDKENPHQFGPGGGFIGTQLAKKTISKKHKIEQDHEIVLNGKLSPLIPPGDYEVQYVGMEKQLQGKAPKLVLIFEILMGSEFQGVKLRMYCPMGGKLGDGSKLVRMVTIALRERPYRVNRMSIKKTFGGKIFNALVKTVTTDWKQHPISQEAHYSKIEHLISRIQ